MGTGSEFVKKLKPFGAALFLIMFVLYMVICFTAKIAPVKGYSPPESEEYYAASPEALAQEINDGLLSRLDYDAVCTAEDGRAVITAPAEELEKLKKDVTYYFDESLLEFRYE